MGNVKIFRSTDFGAPPMYGAIGGMLTVLNACLVDGYGSMSVTSLTHAGGLVTATTSSPHGLKELSRQTISGVSNDTAYNGEFIITPTGESTFTYNAAGIVQATATGTILTKSASAGWTKPYSGTNLAAYRMGGGNMRYLRIDDTTITTCRAVGYETMSAISTGVNPFPSAAQFTGGLYFQKSFTADATNNRPWILIADDKGFYLHVDWNTGGVYTDSPIMHFGDFVSDKVNDVFNTMILADVSGAAVGFRFGYLTTQVQTADTGMYICRSHTQIGTSTPGSKISDYAKGNGQAVMGGTPGLVYPHQVNGGLYLAPVWVCESAPTAVQSVVRGTMRGILNPLHYRPLAHGDIFYGSGSLAGKVFIALGMQLNAMVMIEVSLTW